MVNVEREAVWKERFNQWRESGLSQRAYALLLHGFYRGRLGTGFAGLTPKFPSKS